MTLLRLFVTVSLQNIDEDDLSERDDYGVPFSKQLYTHGCCYISFFKCTSFDQSDTPRPRTASNFRHLLSSGTMESHSKIETSINS